MKLLNHYRTSIIIVIFVAVFGMGKLAQAETITVGPSRFGNYDYDTIQDGIDAANDGDVVLVAPKEYEITEPITFQGKAITVRSEAGPEQTTICITWGNYVIVIFENGEDSGSLLEGFTIKDCPETGLFCEDSSPCIENCIFLDNWECNISCSSSSPIINNCSITGSMGGGGINCGENSSPTITNCIIWGNTAQGTGGGGILCRDSLPIITDCIITENTAGNEGGGILCINSSPTFINCTISNNTANNGAGMHNKEKSSPKLINCTFSGNSAEDNGGGMWNGDCNPTMIDCTISENSANRGGGMYNNNNSNPTLTDCTFDWNYAVDGAGMFNRNSSPELSNCVFSNNFADRGGGMYNERINSNPRLINCIFSGNEVFESGGGMFNISGCSPTLRNCTLSGNLAQWYGGGIYNTSSNTRPIVINSILRGNTASIGAQVYEQSISSTTVSYSNVQLYGRLCWPGEGNINIDPLFADPDNGDYHLKSKAGRWNPNSQSWVFDDVNSPCIDTGDPNSPVAFEPYPNGVTINMGAYGGTTEASKSPSGLYAKYGGGTGEQNNPYLIYTAEQLNTLGAEPNDYDKYFRLVADVNLAEYLYDRAVIAPDYNDSSNQFAAIPFTGTFDGNGHVISNLTIAGYNYLGLFGYLDDDAIVLNLGIEAVDIHGVGDYVSGLVGSNYGNIIECYSNGEVRGNEYVGGLVGSNSIGGSITNCYSNVIVNGNEKVGGLTGYTKGEVTKCYSAGEVISTGLNTGGLVGEKDPDYGLVTDCFWDIETSGQSTSAGGTGKSTVEMQTKSTFMDAGWDFLYEMINGDEDFWWIDEGDYPHLCWEPRIEPYQTVVSGYVDVNTIYQELEGFGAGGIWYEGWLTAHPSRNEIYDCLFGQLGLDIYKIRNTYDIDSEYITNSAEIISNAELSLGHPIKTIISSWTPPVYLKSNSSLEGGTLRRDSSDNYMYEQFAQWWADSLAGYSTHGITADYISIQNVPNDEGDDTCKFTPTETTDYAGYNLAFEAVYQKLNSDMNSMPKMLAPEAWGYGDSQEYIDSLIEPDNVYGFNYYEESLSIWEMENFAAKNGHKPLFKGEDYDEYVDSFSVALNLAMHIHDGMVHENLCSFFYGDLFWGEEGGLVTIDNPWQFNPGYTINPIYYAFKQYSAFTDPGWHRVEVSIDSDELRACAFISPDSDQLSIIIINTSESRIALMLSLDYFMPENSGIYRTSEDENAVYLGTFDYTEPLLLPAESITTVSLGRGV